MGGNWEKKKRNKVHIDKKRKRWEAKYGDKKKKKRKRGQKGNPNGTSEKRKNPNYNQGFEVYNRIYTKDEDREGYKSSPKKRRDSYIGYHENIEVKKNKKRQGDPVFFIEKKVGFLKECDYVFNFERAEREGYSYFADIDVFDERPGFLFGKAAGDIRKEKLNNYQT